MMMIMMKVCVWEVKALSELKYVRTLAIFFQLCFNNMTSNNSIIINLTCNTLN